MPLAFAAVSRVMLAAWPWITRIGVVSGIGAAAWAAFPLLISIRKLGEQVSGGVDHIPDALPFTVEPDGQGGTQLAPKTNSTPIIIGVLVGGALLLVLASRR